MNTLFGTVDKAPSASPTAIDKLREWFFAAEPGASYIYYIGNLAADRGDPSARRSMIQIALSKLANEVLGLARSGQVTLSQRRLRNGGYEYIVTKTGENDE